MSSKHVSFTYRCGMRARGGRGARCRRMVRPGHWGVRARVERFSEPALLLMLRERPTHGYELLEALPAVTGEARVDMGNLYRVLRALEENGLERLESYQRDLEQELADVSDLITRLRAGEAPGQPQPQTV